MNDLVSQFAFRTWALREDATKNRFADYFLPHITWHHSTFNALSRYHGVSFFLSRKGGE